MQKLFSGKEMRVKLFSGKGKRGKKKKAMPCRRLISAGIATVCLGLIALGIWWMISIHREETVARLEYRDFSEKFQENREIVQSPPDIEEPDEDIEEDREEELGVDHFFYELAEINPDFIGWISIKDIIDYPVVLGSDNYKYIHTTFSGERNSAGAIFMDYRNRGGFNDHIVILFGHRTRNRTMFSPLAGYLNREFLIENPFIVITTKNREDLTYRVFAAKQTDAWDAAYEAAFASSGRATATFPSGAPVNAQRFLLLSTCTASSEPDERIIVYAALVEDIELGTNEKW